MENEIRSVRIFVVLVTISIIMKSLHLSSREKVKKNYSNPSAYSNVTYEMVQRLMAKVINGILLNVSSLHVRKIINLSMKFMYFWMYPGVLFVEEIFNHPIITFRVLVFLRVFHFIFFGTWAHCRMQSRRKACKRRATATKQKKLTTMTTYRW